MKSFASRVRVACVVVAIIGPPARPMRASP
jgi:hypothetical protein